MFACCATETKVGTNHHVGFINLPTIPKINDKIKIDNVWWTIKEVGEFNPYKFLNLMVY